MPDATTHTPAGGARWWSGALSPSGRVGFWLLPAVVALCVALPKAWQGEFSVDTGWYGAIAHQAWSHAVESGGMSLWRPEQADGLPFFNKPPLGLWLGGLFMVPLGASVLAARLGSILAACACVALTGVLGARASDNEDNADGEGSRRVGFVCALVCALTVEFVRHARSFSLDLWLTLFLLGALVCAVEGVRRERGGGRGAGGGAGRGGRWVLLAGVCVGLSLLVKPLVGLLALVAVAAWLAWIGRWRLSAWCAGALVVALAVAAPWHVSMWLIDGDGFTSAYFGTQIGARLGDAGASEAIRVNQGASSAWYYLVVIATKYWPWLPVLALALIDSARGRFGRGREGWAVRLVIVWTVLWLVALSVVGDKRPRYMLPLYPVWALGVGLWLVRLAPVGVRRGVERAGALAAPVALGVALAVSVLPIRVHGGRSAQWDELFAWMRDEGVRPDQVWSAGFEGAQAARVYLQTGSWAQVPRGPDHRPTPGDVVLYFLDEPARPGPGERVVLETGKVLVTRLQDGAVFAPVR